MLRAIVAIAALLLATVAYYIDDLIKKRKQLDGLPQPPMLNKLVGHLNIAGELNKVFPHRVHAQVWGDYMRTKWNLPEIFYLDLRPFGPLTMYVADPVAASKYVTTTTSLPKAPAAKDFLDKFLGKNNMVSLEGAQWKNLRSIFNPGFSLTNIMTLSDVIVDASLTFCDIIRSKVASGELFELEDLCTGLTIEIIGKVVLDADLQAQTQTHPITTLFRERSRMMPPSDAVFPWQAVDLLRPYKLWRNGGKLDRAISKELDLKIERRAKELMETERRAKPAAKKRSVVDLAMNAYEKEISAARNIDFRLREPKGMPDSLRMDISDSVKTFIFAGHDTTSSTLCWANYFLHKHPEVYAKVRKELDTYLPGGLAETAAKIKEDPYTVNKLEYTVAVLKETLRIFPPASTVRGPVHGGYIVDSGTQEKLPMIGDDACLIWPVSHLIHRNKRFFPRPTEFIPERFIPSQTPFPDAELFTEAGKDAFRPFEKGPRNCIGQELAMLEGKIILALTAREFDFVLEYPGEEADIRYPVPESTAEELSKSTEYGKAIRAGTQIPDRVEGHRVYPMLLGAAKPVGGCPGRVYYRNK
ncbi:Uu.00g099530.m01.CDS01 [Anthostomella pinea]|uniref:Uu.00g099530.m01.CDS01 n=1 Tax=Anthostomella pinea TaxID=933095 RepID=A0AAI8YCU4_9PEZI|nr:Uu.00g099530.m01.CDS01 [Anthostomella pinea]